MATYDALMDQHASGTGWGEGPWLRSPHWDLFFLTLSGAFVVIPLILFELMGRSAMFINLFVAGVIGGPHMYVTFFRTALGFVDTDEVHSPGTCPGCLVVRAVCNV
jgi:hypothetical protein